MCSAPCDPLLDAPLLLDELLDEPLEPLLEVEEELPPDDVLDEALDEVLDELPLLVELLLDELLLDEVLDPAPDELPPLELPLSDPPAPPPPQAARASSPRHGQINRDTCGIAAAYSVRVTAGSTCRRQGTMCFGQHVTVFVEEVGSVEKIVAERHRSTNRGRWRAGVNVAAASTG